MSLTNRPDRDVVDESPPSRKGLARIASVAVMGRPQIREYRDGDAESWVRCRALSFLGSSYYDDVRPHRLPLEQPALGLVAVGPRPRGVRTPGPDQVVGILDVEVWEDDGVTRATIETVATHPDHARHGIAAALLQRALAWLQEQGAATLDAWTREDEAANAWYRRHGFTLRDEYLHVHKRWDDDDTGFISPEPLSAPVLAFAHARLEDETAVRARFTRVHRCRQYLRDLT